MHWMRILPLLALVLLLPGLAAGVTTYDIVLDQDTARMNITVELYPENPDRATRYSTGWTLPAGTTVQQVVDSDGPVDFTQEGDSVSFTTRIEAGKEKEVVTITALARNVVDSEFRGLDRVTLQLSGFEDTQPAVPEEVTQVQVSAKRNLLAGSHSFGFDAAMGAHTANYTGEGPVNIKLAVSDQGTEYDNLVLFGPGNISTADDLYWVPVAVTGFHPPINRYPVIVYEDDRYDEVVDTWSAGQYRGGGLIFIRNSTLASDHGPAVVLHEVMHGFNDHALNWFSGDRAWFDEGTAQYVEWLVNAKRGVPQAEVFGEEVSWRCGTRTRCSYAPRGTPEQLWTFYQRNESFLASWTPLQSPDEATREFGYALSELIVRNYVRTRGGGALQEVYTAVRQLNQELERQLDNAAATQRLKEIMGTDFRPCAATGRDAFDTCLDKVHAMEPVIPEPPATARQVEAVPITPVENPQPGNRSTMQQVRRQIEPVQQVAKEDAGRLLQFLQGFLHWLLSPFR